MHAAISTFQSHFSFKSFLIGLGMVIAIYGGMFGFITMQSQKTLIEMENKLASHSAIIERDNITSHATVAKHHEEQPGTEHHIGTHHQLASNHDQHAGAARALVPAPFDGLYEENEHGDKLPIVGENKLTPFKAYKKPFAVSGENPVIAIVVLDYGLSGQFSELALKTMPAEVSLILSPYSDHTDSWQQRAREAGHEVWLYLPIQNQMKPLQDPGQQALLSRASLKYNQERLGWALSRTTGYAGVVSYSDEAFNEATPMLQNLFKSVFSRGLGYIELNPKAPPFIETIALSQNTPYARNQIFLENTSLRRLEQRAKEYGYAVGILKPYPNAMKSAHRWMDTLSSKGFTIVPVSAIAEFSAQ